MSPPQQDAKPGGLARGFVQISVPEEIYEDVIEYIAHRLRRRRKHIARRSDPAAEPSANSEHEVWQEPELRELMERANPSLQNALVAIARSPNRELRTEDLAEAAGVRKDQKGRVGKAWGGLMSRANVTAKRHWNKTELPMYADTWDPISRQYRYRIEEEDAVVIRSWADEHGH